MKKANHNFMSSGTSPKFYQHDKTAYSDGIKAMADATASFWLVDLIDYYQSKLEVNGYKFQCWELLRASESIFDIIATDSHNHIIISHQVSHITFQYDAATIWVVNKCLILPNEYVNCHAKPTPIIPTSISNHSSLN